MVLTDEAYVAIRGAMAAAAKAGWPLGAGAGNLGGDADAVFMAAAPGNGGGGTMPSVTPPTGTQGGTPTGTRTAVPPAEAPENVRALTRENESADTLAAAGYRVQQNPPSPPGSTRNPDYLIEGRYFDNYAPNTTNPDRIAENLMKKPGSGQATRVVLNLDDVPGVDLARLRESIEGWRLTPGSGMDKLEEIIVVRGGQVIPLFP